MFKLHSRLKEDCHILGQSELSLLLLMNDLRYPWFIMVPKRPDIKEIFQLSGEDQLQLARESANLAFALSTAFKGDKINIASLGNVVSQLHIHHIVRFKNDPAWPGPVWGHSKAIPYADEAREMITGKIKAQLKKDFNFCRGAAGLGDHSENE
ncbi:MAG: HIT family protein [Deltaproteobacteria bacterium]|nr:HIT family protein [Deltaproteobacteria bacterium]